MLCFAQAFSQTQPDFFVDPISENGLFTVITRSLAADPNGYLYVGTNDGLYKFDGQKFTRFPSTEAGPASCPISNVRSLLVEGETLWVAGVEGLVRMNMRTEQFESVPLPSPDKPGNRSEIKRLKRLPNGQLFIGAYRGFYLLSPEEKQPVFVGFKALPADPDLAYATAAALDDQAVLWIGSYSGNWAIRLPGSTEAIPPEEHFKGTESLPRAAVYDMGTSSSGTLLAATSKGLFRLNPSTGEATPVPLRDAADHVIDPAVRRILPMPEDGRYLLATFGDGLLDWNERTQGNRQHVSDSRWYNSLPGNDLNELLLMPNGLLWVATEDFGLARIHTGLSYIQAQVLPDFDQDQGSIGVNDVVVLNGTYWLATSHGLVSHRPGEGYVRHRDPADGSLDYLQTMHALSDDELVFQRMREAPGVGSYRISTQQFGYLDFPEKQRVADAPVFDWLSHVDAQGRLFLSDMEGTYYRCHYQSRRTDTLFTVAQVSLPLPLVIPIDEEQLLLIAGSRLYRYGIYDEVLKPLQADAAGNRLPNVSFQEDLIVRPGGKVWIATDQGLFRYDMVADKLTRFTVEEGLPSNICFSIFTDPNGRIFVPFPSGLFEFKEEDNSVISYLMPRMVASSPTPSFGPDGACYQGAQDVYFRIPWDSLLPHTTKPLLRLLSVRHRDSLLTTPEQWENLALRFGDFPLVVQYELLDFFNPELCQTRYQMLGWDETFLDDENQNSRAIYSRLTAGDYTFTVQGRNPVCGLEATQSLSFSVLAPFWQTTWFTGLMVLLAFAIPFTIYRYRLSQLQRIQQIRNHIAGDLHDDIGSTLSSIRIYSDIVRNQVGDCAPEATPLLDRMSENAGEMLESMSDIVWAIKPDNDALENIESRIFHIGTERCSAKGVLFSMENPSANSNIRINMEARRDLLLLFKEFLNNSLKYSDCQHFAVQIQKNAKALTVTFRDDGKGFDLNQYSQGNGLTSMRHRAEKNGWTFELHSGLGEGTSLSLGIRPV